MNTILIKLRISLLTMFLSSILLFLGSYRVVTAQVEIAAGTFAAGTLVSGIISDLEDAASSLLDQLDDRLSARSFQMRNDLIFLQDELSHSAEKLVDKTFKELSKEQQVFFENASATISQVSSIIDQVDAEVDSLATQIEQIAAQFPFVGEEPRIRRSTPIFLTPPAAPVLVNLEGSFLKHGDAHLEIDKHQCTLKGHRDSAISFSCPAAVFVNNTLTVKHLSGDLIVNDELSFWQKITSFFGSDVPTKEYKVPINVVPAVLGEFNVDAIVLVDTVEKKSRSGRWGQSNPHCKGKVTKNANFSAASKEWEIDVNSIKTSVSCGRGKEGHAQRNVSVNGFQIESWASNSGRCEKVFGSVVSKDARGCSAGTVSWLEMRKISTRETKSIESGRLKWGESVSVPLPNNLEGFLLTVHQIDKQVVKLNAAKSEKWITVARDANNTSLIVSPLSVVKAMN